MMRGLIEGLIFLFDVDKLVTSVEDEDYQCHDNVDLTK